MSDDVQGLRNLAEVYVEHIDKLAGCAVQSANRIKELESENKALQNTLDEILKLASSRSIHPMDQHADYFRLAYNAKVGKQ